MKRKFLTAVLIVAAFFNSPAQNFREQFSSLMKNRKDSLAQQKMLDSWKSANPEDPELYVAYYNYYVIHSKTEMLSLQERPVGKESLSVNSPDSKAPVAYINEGTFYNREMINKGFAYIDTGITKYPSRLDMRFGKIYMLAEIKDYENLTRETIKTIDYSNTIKNKWTWTNNDSVENPEKFMLGNIQHYVIALYNTEDDALAENIKDISEAVLKYYTGHVESLSNLSLAYMLKKDFDKALAPLLKAEKIAPADYIVLSNIAHCYDVKGDAKNAIKYYELTLKYGDEPAKEFAKEKLDSLRKK